MKYVIQRTIHPWEGEYYAGNILTTKLSEANIYDSKEQAKNHPCWNEYDPQAFIKAISEKKLFKAKLANI